jgi:hypothetical protein
MKTMTSRLLHLKLCQRVGEEVWKTCREDDGDIVEILGKGQLIQQYSRNI